MKRTDKKAVFSTPWFELVAKTFEGSEAPFYTIEVQDYVHVLAATADGQILTVRQFRPALEKSILDFPCGHVDEGLTPEEAARAELLEETGFTADHFEFLGRLNSDVGRMSNTLWCFAAKDARPATGDVEREPGVELELHKLEDVPRLIESGELENAFTLAVLALAQRKGWDLLKPT
jgi:ADP-ribose pyrophosphatase